MDDELQQLEAELKKLRPAPPSRELTARVQVELAAPLVSSPASRMYWWWAAALPAAAAITLALVYFSSGRMFRSPASGTATTTADIVASGRGVAEETPLKPVAAEKILISASDEGIVTLEDGTQARRERLRFVDTITWRNSRTNASLTWSVPREEVRVVPVVFQ